MKPGRNPILILILNFIVGLAVSHGVVPAEHQDYYVEAVSEIVGYLIIAATSGVSLYHVWKSHHIPAVTVTETTTTTTETPAVELPKEVEELPVAFRG